MSASLTPEQLADYRADTNHEVWTDAARDALTTNQGEPA